MSKFCVRWLLVWVIVAGWSVQVRGQEPESAEAILTRAHAMLTSLPHLEVAMVSREINFVNEGRMGAPGGERPLRILNSAYQQVRATYRQPDDWRVVTQREREANQQLTAERKLAFGKMGSADATVLLINSVTEELTRMTIPVSLFRQELLERAGVGLREDPVLGVMMFNRADVGAAAFKLERATVAGGETVNGVRLVRLTATKALKKVDLWIDEGTGLIARVLVTPLNDRSGLIRMQETLYTYDLLRGFDSADFDLDAGWKAAASGFSASAGFAPMREVAALVGASRVLEPSAPSNKPPTPSPPPEQPRTPPVAFSPTAPIPAAPASPSAGAGAGAAAAATPAPTQAVEEQVLKPEQMDAIVLVEGDDGVGSGFIARIRDVDFVVTNQHVIGGNDKVRVTNVRGVQIKVGSVFGAVGRDLAILRIEGDYKVTPFKIASDPVQTAKIGDKVAVIGNRRGGGVATQVSGVVRGIGPDKIEVDAPFQPGNSGSPIIHAATGEVIGLATYSLTRRLDQLDGVASGTSKKADEKPATEQRWFGHRADGISKWEAIDQAKWRAQAKRVEEFASDSEAIYYAMYGRFKEASSNTRVSPLIARMEDRASRFGSSQALVSQEVQEFFRGLRALAETGVKDLKTGDYYDYFRTNMYWETSITEQLRAREDIMRRLDRASENSAAFLARLRR